MGYLIEGSLEMTVENRAYELKPGDTIYLQKDTPGKWRNTADTTAELLWLKFKK
jgi:quercetin dioxygenase-like cupin family protein